MRISKVLVTCLLSIFLLTGCRGEQTNTKPTDQAKNQLVVTIVDIRTQSPVANAYVSLILEGSEVKPAQLSDADGHVTFKNVADGDGYQALVTKTVGYRSITSQEMLVPGNPDNAVLVEKVGNGEGSGLIAGSFKDTTTKTGITGMSINCVGTKFNKTLATDERGSFRVEGLLAGKYTITARKFGYEAIQKTVNIVDGQALTIPTIWPKRTGIGTLSTGNYLVSLNGSKKVVEMDSKGNTIWSYSNINSIESSTRAVTGDTFISDGLSSKIIHIASPENNTKTDIFFFGGLKFPTWIDALDEKSFLITDNGADKIAEFSNGVNTWNYTTSLNRPKSAVYLNNGNILIADTGNQKIIEVNRDKKIVWSFSKDMDKPSHALRLNNGNTLITDLGYSRVFEIDYTGKVVWWYSGVKTTPKAGQTQKSSVSNNSYKATDVEDPNDVAEGLLFPRSSLRLPNGNTLIADTGNNRIIEVSKDKKIVNEIKNLSRPVSLELL